MTFGCIEINLIGLWVKVKTSGLGLQLKLSRRVFYTRKALLPLFFFLRGLGVYSWRCGSSGGVCEGWAWGHLCKREHLLATGEREDWGKLWWWRLKRDQSVPRTMVPAGSHSPSTGAAGLASSRAAGCLGRNNPTGSSLAYTAACSCIVAWDTVTHRGQNWD